MERTSRPLSDEHRKMLSASSIGAAEIFARGYETVTNPERLKALGFRPNQAKVPSLLIPLYDACGNGGHYQCRPDNPRLKGSKPVKYETPAGTKIIIDVPPSVREHLGNPGVPLWITEGVKKADAAVTKGLCCIALSGVWNWRGTNGEGGLTALPDWEFIHLKGRRVYLAFDSDMKDNENVRKALLRLIGFLEYRGAEALTVNFPSLDGRKVGLDDYFATGGQVQELLANAVVFEPDSAKEPKSPLARIDKLCQGYSFFHTAETNAFVSFKNGDHRETHAVNSKGFRLWLSRLYYREFGQVLGSSAMDDVVNGLTARGIFDGPEKAVFIRIAHHEGKVYVDLGDPEWTVIEIDSQGWRVCADPPISFRRFPGMLALPLPQTGGNLETLRPHFNAEDDADFALIAGFIVGAYMNPARGTFAHLALAGEKGTSKSTTATRVVQLIDPRAVILRQLTNAEDVTIAASRSKILAFDNIGRLLPAQSNLLCALATGGGVSKRLLYSNDDEHVILAKTPVVMTSVEDIVTATDLADRCLFPRLTKITEGSHKSEEELETQFQSDLPRMLGWVFTAISTALKNLSAMGNRPVPRLADFFLWVVAADEAFGQYTGLFEQAFRRSQVGAAELAIDDSVLARLVLEVVSNNPSQTEYTATNLLHSLNELASDSEKRELPKSNKLRGELRKIGSLLRHRGITFDESQTRSAKRRPICLRRDPECIVTGVTTVTPSSSEQVRNDGRDDCDDSSGNWEDVPECEATA